MESTTDLNEAAGKVRSRRALLAGAVGGLGAWLVSAAQRGMPADAAVGDPVLAGKRNSGGGFTTEVRANTDNAASSAPSRSEAATACAARRPAAEASSAVPSRGTGVLGESEVDGIGVSGRGQQGGRRRRQGLQRRQPRSRGPQPRGCRRRRPDRQGDGRRRHGDRSRVNRDCSAQSSKARRGRWPCERADRAR